MHRQEEDGEASGRVTPALGGRFDEALVYAAELHRQQWRKGSGIPYVGHLLGVASLVLEARGDEDQAIAALLHDAVEDQGGAPTLARIRRRFGDRVADIVEACSDPWGEPTPPWLERKRVSLGQLWSAPADALLVALADKLYNAQALLREYRLSGDALWERFEATRDQKLWFYGELSVLFQERFPGWMTEEFSAAVRELGVAAGGGPAVAPGAGRLPSPVAGCYRVAACQFEPVPLDTGANLSTMERLARDAVGQGAELVVFPECCLTGYGQGPSSDRMVELAEPVWGETRGSSVRAMEAAAEELGAILCFGMPERVGDAVYNAQVTVSPDRGVLSAYHKTHLWETEGRLFARGAAFQVLEAPVGRFAPFICYDLEFPEAVRSAALLGAQLAAVSSANMRPWEESQRIYARSRAMENSIFVVVANCIGRPGPTEFFGGSIIADPLGHVLAEAGGDEAVLVAEVDLSRIPSAAADLGYLHKRRPELYGEVVRVAP